MKSILLAFSLTISLFASAQVTQLSNNTNIKFGLPLGNSGIFVARGGLLWSSDGTAAGTVQFTSKVLYDTSGSVAFLNGKLYFSGISATSGDELWVTDGTDAGTSLVMDINPGAADSKPSDFVVMNNKIIFNATTTSTGRELWISDGTPGGTSLLKDIFPGASNGIDSSANTNFRSFLNNNIYFFTATDGTNGTELWKTDGTTAGTVLLKDVTPGKDSTTFEAFAAYGTKTIFERLIGSFFSGQLEIWITDGTDAGTILLKNFGDFSGFPFYGSITFNNIFYFNAISSGTTGNEFWCTNGTPAGTILVKDINPGPPDSDPFLLFSPVFNNTFLFNATTANEGSELWISDGTPGGTQLFKDINPGTASSNAIPLINFSGNFSHTNLYNGKSFVVADDGTHGQELWITDGSSAGTQMVKDIQPGSGGGLKSISTYFYTTSGLYFGADDGTNGTELWLSDGTAAGTNMVQDLNPGKDSSNPEIIGLINNHLYFTANNGDNTNGDRDLYIVNASLTALPVTLLNFTASAQGKDVRVNWATSIETNSKYFKLERSEDGTNFTNIATLDAAGNSSGTLHYEFLDKQASMLNVSTLYYRLQMEDKDGAKKLSSIAAVQLHGAIKNFSIMPNPVQNQLTVDFAGNGASKLNLRIVNSAGQTLYQQDITPGASSYRQTIKVSSFPKGTYYLQLITDRGINSSKFIKE